MAIQENHYDPFGLALPIGLVGQNRYQFLNRESQEETGYIDLIHRQFDPKTNRFFNIDPVTNGQESLSTYQYGWNNPMLRPDPNGDCPTCRELIDFMAGTVSAFMEDNIPVATNYTHANGSREYKAGVKAGHMLALIGGAAEVITGIGGDATAVVGEAATGGLATVAALPLAVASTEMILHGGATFSKAVYNLNSGGEGKNGGSFGAGKDTKSNTQREAFNKAKEQNGIPKSQQPEKQYNTPDKNTNKPLKTYEYKNSKGEKVVIRKDNPVTYPDGGSQGKHFNASKVKENTDKLKQHHDYGKN